MDNTNRTTHTYRKTNKAYKFALLVFLFVLVFASALTAYLVTDGNAETAQAMTGNSGFNSNYPRDISYNVSSFNLNQSTYFYLNNFSLTGGGNVTFRHTSNNQTGYYAWEIRFTDDMYYAVLNGAIGNISAKLTMDGSGNSDGKRYRVLSSHPSWNNGTVLGTASKDGGFWEDHTFSPSLTVTGGQLAKVGSTYILYNELVVYGGGSGFGAGQIDSWLTGAWLDINRTDTTAPTMGQTGGTGSKTFTFTDSSGVSRIEYSTNGGTNWTTVNRGSGNLVNTSGDSKTLTWTAPRGGTFLFKVYDNVGNVYTTPSTSSYFVLPTYSGGDGLTANTAFVLAKRADFDDLSSTVNGGYLNGYSGYYFKVQPETSTDQPGGTYINMLSTPFTPTGTSSNAFKGVIDGQNYPIYNLSVSIGDYAGLFGYAYGATFNNMYVGSGSVTGQDCVGGIVGCADYGTFYNCKNGAAIIGRNYLGGIAGLARYGAFSGDFNNYSYIQGSGSYSGGIFGILYLDRSITANFFHSGAAGVSSDSVRAVYYAGGIFGSVENNYTITGTKTWTAAGEIDHETGSGAIYGGFVGVNRGATLNADMTFSGRVITRGSGNPGPAAGGYAGGIVGYNQSGTIGGAGRTIINNASDVIAVGNNNYLGGIVGYNAGTLLGNFTNKSSVGYSGSVYAGQWSGGIIGYNNGTIGAGTYTNNGVVRGTNYVGGVVGEIGGSTALSSTADLKNYGAVTATGQYVGGVVGIMHAGTLCYATNEASVNGTNNVGGIAGRTNGGAAIAGIRDASHNTGIRSIGAVTGTYAVGGIVGRANGNVSGCYNWNTVTANGGAGSTDSSPSGALAGGIVGIMVGGYTISNCYNTGSVTLGFTSTANYVGGIVGYTTGTVQYCATQNITVGGATNIGGIAGQAGTVNYCYVLGVTLYNSWDNDGAYHDTITPSGTKTNSWAIYSQNTSGYRTTRANRTYAKLVYPTSSGTVSPCVNYTYVSGADWFHIINNNYTAFMLSVTSTANTYVKFTQDNPGTGTGGTAVHPGYVTNTGDSGGNTVPVQAFYYATTYSLTPDASNPYRGIIATNGNAINYSNPSDLIYTGLAKPCTAGSLFSGYSMFFKYGTSTTAPTDVGTYAVTATVYYSSQSYVLGRRTGSSYTVSKNTITTSWAAVSPLNSSFTAVYNGSPMTMTVTLTASSTLSNWSTYIEALKNASTMSNGTKPTGTANADNKTVTLTFTSDADVRSYVGTLQSTWGDSNYGFAAGQTLTKTMTITKNYINVAWSATNPSFTYDGVTHNFVATITTATAISNWSSIINELKNSNYAEISNSGAMSQTGTVVVDQNGFSGNNTAKITFTGGPNVGTYTALINNWRDVYSEGNFGFSAAPYTNTLTINTANITNSRFTFGFIGDGVTGDRVNLAAWSGSVNYFKLDSASGGNSVLYGSRASATYVQSNFKVFDSTAALNRPIKYDANVIDSDYTVSVLMDLDADPLTWNTPLACTVTLTGTGNYTGTFTKYYLLIISDFAILDGQTRADGTWGSENNPFVISNWVHLLRLSQIVNGNKQPIDSVNNYSIVSNVNTYANDITFDGAYFRVTQNVTAYSVNSFIPIGNFVGTTNKKPFSGIFDGGSKTIDLAIGSSDFGAYHQNYAGLFGYTQYAELKNINLTGYVCGGSQTGGLVGYADTGTQISNISYSGSVTSNGDNVGGLVGLLNGTFDASAYASSTTGNIIGANKVGGIIGFVNTGNIKGTFGKSAGYVVASGSYAGGLVGHYKLNADAALTLSFTASSGTGNSLSYLGKGDMVRAGVAYYGGLFGYVEGNFVASGNWTVNSGEVDNEDDGGSVVGGVAGYNSATLAANMTVDCRVISRSSSTQGGLTGAFAGGIVGYNAGTIGGTSTTITRTGIIGDILSVSGASYLGGIVGYNSGTLLGTFVNKGIVGATNDTNYYADNFVGGIAGYHKSSASLTDVKFTNNGKVVASGSYVGGLFGYAEGAGRLVITSNTLSGITVRTKTTSDYVGSIAGLLIGIEVWHEGTSEYTNTIAISGRDNVGGLIGYLGARGNISSQSGQAYVNNARIDGRNYVGGIAGCVYSGAGEAYNVAEKIYQITTPFRNYALVVASGSYVGGIIGGTINNSENATAKEFTRISSILYNRNNISGISYIGGLVGSVQSNFIMMLGKGTANEGGTVSGSSYIGGLFGYLGANAHLIDQVYNLSTVTATGNYAGGLVAEMLGGTIKNSFITYSGSVPNQNLLATTDLVKAANYAGGIVGSIESGTLQNCLTQGFKFDGNTSASKGGVAGYAHNVNALLVDTWAIYAATNPTYSSVSANTNGKYIVVDQSVMRALDRSEINVIMGMATATTYYNASLQSSLEAMLNNVSIGAALPYSPYQIAIYDASGNNKESSNAFNFANQGQDTLYIRLTMSGSSFIVCSVEITFNDIDINKDNTANEWISRDGRDNIGISPLSKEFERGYFEPSGYSSYFGTAGYTFWTEANKITKLSTQIMVKGEVKYLHGGVFYNFSREYSNTFSIGSSIMPRTISNISEWNTFASLVRNGGNSQTWKLLNNITDGSVTAGNLAGITDTSNVFRGTFDGNGFSIPVNITSGGIGTSLFPSASGTIKNLTVTGTINTSSAYTSETNVAAFVGKVSSNSTLALYNCTNEARITINNGAVGGMVGFASSGANLTVVGCVNKGEIYCTSTSDGIGAGGIIGNINTGSGSLTIDSCRNDGKITSAYHVGGVVGYTNATTKITNCANTGEVISSSGVQNGYYSNTGGIVGVSTKGVKLSIYACYNSGNVTGGNSGVGGIVGRDSDDTGSGTNSEIYYCYNTGTITSGDGSNTVFQDRGTQVGGIAGRFIGGTIAYSYNTGNIRCRGIQGVVAAWDRNAGGLIGYAYNDTNIRFCYNVGLVEVVGNTTRGNCFASLVGYGKNSLNVTASYSIQNNVRYDDNGSYTYTTNNGTNGTVLGSIADLTAVYTLSTGSASNGMKYVDRILPMSAVTSGANTGANTCFGITGSAYILAGETPAERNARLEAEPVDGANGGWVYMYGCLPQLSIFALNTTDGLSMLSRTYTYNSDAGRYEEAYAGTKYNPYIIKDGIDLLGMSALTAASRRDIYWKAENNYIEFATKNNNSSADPISAYIQMPTSATATTNYKYATSLTGSATGTGKSYHLYQKGAASYENLGKNPNDSSSARTDWQNRNYRYVGTTATSGTTLAQINFYPMGMYGNPNTGSREFSGSLNGLQIDGTNTEIRGLKVERTFDGNLYNSSGGPHATTPYNNPTCVGGLFGLVTSATIANITVCGTVTGGTTAVGSDVFVGGIVAYARGTATLTNLKAGKDSSAAGKLTVKAIAQSNNTGTSRIGGIAGGATAVASYDTITIENCTTNADITGYHNSVGGIVGRAGVKANSGLVYVVGCNVATGTISSTGSTATRSDSNACIGGIVGGRETGIGVIIESCWVGTKGNTNPVTTYASANVIIKGENAVGGIISQANGDTAVKDCVVYGNVALVRAPNVASAANHSVAGTAFGGVIGYAEDGTCTVSGNTAFYGMIDTYSLAGASAATSNIGGIFGFMGMGTTIRPGYDEAQITVGGYIYAGSGTNVENIGGVVGLVEKYASTSADTGTMLDGTYHVYPTISAANAKNVGGVIGKNNGTFNVVATANLEIGNNGGTRYINARENVGGFIGLNAGTRTLNIGATSYGGVDFPATDTYKKGLIANLYYNINGVTMVGGFIGKNEGIFNAIQCEIINHSSVGTGDASKGANSGSTNKYFGGVLGYNNEGGTINFGKDSYFENRGQVGHATYGTAFQEYVGGVIGSSAGAFNSASIMVNTGNVYGYRYVGGSIGELAKGTVGGTFINTSNIFEVVTYDGNGNPIKSSTATYSGSGNVSGVEYVGGAVGVIRIGGTIKAGSTFGNVGTVYIYKGEVSQKVLNSYPNRVEIISTTVTATNKVTVKGDDKYVGGMIGAMFGTISGETANLVTFINSGEVGAKVYSGGLIGVLAGSVNWASFVNTGHIGFSGGDAIGGAVGYVTDDISGSGGSVTTSITNSHFAHQNGGLTATGTSTANIGGVGGVFGLINAAQINSSSRWSGNTFFVSGNVTAGSATYVGGTVGKVTGAYIQIKNMLNYVNSITGYNYVGGIIGYNDSTNGASDAAASLVNCYNVRGTIVSTITANPVQGGIVGYANASVKTYSCYWVQHFTNEALVNSDIENLGKTLNASWTYATYTDGEGQTHQLTADYLSNHSWPEGYTSWNDYRINGLGADYVYNANGGIGKYTIDNRKTYTTGTVATGFFFVYADDARAKGLARGDIKDSHGFDDFGYWQFIANVNGIADGIGVTDAGGNPISGYGKDGDDKYYKTGSGITSSGNVYSGHLYLAAQPAIENGYYLYMMQSNKTSTLNVTLKNNDPSCFYIDATAATAGNVAVYYKTITISRDIQYNGLDRHVPIQNMTGFFGASIDAVMGSVNALSNDTYFYVTSSTGKDAKTYETDAGIYYKVGGVSYLVGSIYSNGDPAFKWTINARKLDVTADSQSKSGATLTYGNSESFTITFTVGNIAEADLDLLALNSAAITTLVNRLLLNWGLNIGTKPEPVITGAYVLKSTLEKSETYNVNGETAINTYTLTFVYSFKNAREYKLALNSTSDPNYKLDRVEESLIVNARELTVSASGMTVYGYDGNAYGGDLTFGNFASWDEGAVADLMDIIKSLITFSASVAANKAGATDNITNKTILYRGINKSVYSMTWDSQRLLSSLEDNLGKNYKMPSTSSFSFEIAAIAFVMTPPTSRTSTYNGSMQSWVATVKLNSAYSNVNFSEEAWAAIVSKVAATLTPVTGVTPNVVGSTDRKTISITYSAKDAKTYTAAASISGDTYGNYAMALSSFIITINKAPLTVGAAEYAKNTINGSDYVYNTNHLGLTRLPISGIIAPPDTLSAVVSVTATSPMSANKTANNNAITFSGAINVGTYTVTLSTSSTGNYEFVNSTLTYSWTITPYALDIRVNAPGNSIYDGTQKIVTMSINNAPFTGGSTWRYNNDTVTVSAGYTNDRGEDIAVNAGTYTINFSADNVSAARGGTDTTGNYTVTTHTGDNSFTITPMAVTVTWDVADDYHYVYKNAAQGPNLATATFAGISGTKTFSGTNNPYTVSFGTAAGTETLTFTATGNRQTEARTSAYKATVSQSNISVAGTNALGTNRSVIGNFEITVPEKSYYIDKSKVSFSYTSSYEKDYDATPKVNIGAAMPGYPAFGWSNLNGVGVYYSITSSNGGATGSAARNIDLSLVSVSFAGANGANVGTGKTITMVVSIGNSNYVFEDGSTETTSSFNRGTINPRGLTITINDNKGKMYKTYDGTPVYAQYTYGASARSNNFRLGQGFTVTGFPTEEQNGSLIVTANFAESITARSKFDTYVNDVVGTTGIGTYLTGGPYEKLSTATYWKNLVFVLSGTAAGNYKFTIVFDNGQIASTLSDGVQKATVNDSRIAQGNTSTQNITALITINVRQVTASYFNIMQSYVTPSNTYNDEWLPVEGRVSWPSSDSNSMTIAVNNNWSYYDNNATLTELGERTLEDGITKIGKAKYSKYMNIRGYADARNNLGASLYDTTNSGLELNYDLKNQPTLIIGYFIFNEDGIYEVNSLAGLLLASYYYRLPAGDLSETVFNWVRVATDAQYDGGTGIPARLEGSEGEGAYASWDEYFDDLYTLKGIEVARDLVVYIDENGNKISEGWEWGYYKSAEQQVAHFANFKQTVNISGIMTELDYDILLGEWGNLPNFIETGIGNVVTAVGSIFFDTDAEGNESYFAGSYDGQGFIIDTFNIIAYASGDTTLNVGMFAKLGANPVSSENDVPVYGTVSNVHLRNFTISVVGVGTGTINVGGIVGHNQSNKVIDNSSFHGSIIVNAPNATVNVGGIIGNDLASVTQEGSDTVFVSSVNGAISIANIRVIAASANVGGIIGSIRSNGKISNVVSMSEIYLDGDGNVGGIIGDGASATISGTSTYMRNAVYKVGATYNAFNQEIGNRSTLNTGKTYTDLRAGSNSYYLNSASTEYTYDVITFLGQPPQGASSSANNHRYSMRLADIIDTYVLLFKVDFDGAEADADKRFSFNAEGSWLVGNARGTNTDGDRFIIRYQQHVALLREFRFASFEIVQNVVMYTNNQNVVYKGAFYGSIKNDGNNTINVRNDSSDATPKMFEHVISGVAIPLKKD